MGRVPDIDSRPLAAFRELFRDTRRQDRETVIRAIASAGAPDAEEFLGKLFDARLWRGSDGGKVIALTDRGADFCSTRVPVWRQFRQMLR